MSDQTRDWTKRVLDSAVEEVIDNGLVSGPLLQARPAWQLPGALLIAECQVGDELFWLIAGPGSPTDIIAQRLANTPREAGRHFALKWQLGAKQLETGEASPPAHADRQGLGEKVAQLIHCAESLHELVSTDHLWD